MPFAGLWAARAGTTRNLARASREFFYELGLRDGDIPQYLNGLSLIDTYDVLNAIGELWYAEGETEYELLVLRSGVLTLLEFSVGLTQ
ncbi:hypothetical protein [Nannocystis sp. SCPEA4]|uniref:hypothetical protein n=1 Tax=Nannocystis sp. SCPEA4 TaxID=2996787 RepID=UPI0022709025|nr:hypothetical protein [Nannocystis sp. SCPEA4]MCY1058695.1 hypothetical protein [Nannocystis sp. SCPEA4]